MTEKEATALLKSRVDLIKSNYPEIDDYCEALEMAIEALKQESCEDCISREALLTSLEEPMNWTDSEVQTQGSDDIVHNTIIIPRGATNRDMFKVVFGYEPATNEVVCNKADWCRGSEPCNYCTCNSDAIGGEEDWWNTPYKAESEM